jgi:hypothetical protein
MTNDNVLQVDNLGFTPFAAFQSIVIVAFTVLVLQITYQGGLWHAGLVLLSLVIVAVNIRNIRINVCQE